jgi:hypothetical protein
MLKRLKNFTPNHNVRMVVVKNEKLAKLKNYETNSLFNSPGSRRDFYFIKFILTMYQKYRQGDKNQENKNKPRGGK